MLCLPAKRLAQPWDIAVAQQLCANWCYLANSTEKKKNHLSHLFDWIDQEMKSKNWFGPNRHSLILHVVAFEVKSALCVIYFNVGFYLNEEGSHNQRFEIKGVSTLF